MVRLTEEEEERERARARIFWDELAIMGFQETGKIVAKRLLYIMLVAVAWMVAVKSGMLKVLSLAAFTGK